MTHLDIWRAANILLEHFRGEAVFIATRRADTLRGKGDPDGSRTWIRIAKAITALEKQRPGKADTLH
jgi:hypothetical protein